MKTLSARGQDVIDDDNAEDVEQKDMQKIAPKRFPTPRGPEADDEGRENKNCIYDGVFPFLTDAQKLGGCNGDHKNRTSNEPLPGGEFCPVYNTHVRLNLSRQRKNLSRKQRFLFASTFDRRGPRCTDLSFLLEQDAIVRIGGDAITPYPAFHRNLPLRFSVPFRPRRR